MKRVWSLIALGACLAVCGCGSLGKPGGIGGTGVGDLQVSDTEADWLDMLRPGGGKIAQQFLPPKKPAATAPTRSRGRSRTTMLMAPEIRIAKTIAHSPLTGVSSSKVSQTAANSATRRAV